MKLLKRLPLLLVLVCMVLLCVDTVNTWRQMKQLRVQIEAVHQESRIIDAMTIDAVTNINERLKKYEDRHTAGLGI